MLKERIEELVKESLAKNIEQGSLGQLLNVPDLVPVELPKNPEHGDRAISIAMKLAKEAKLAPRVIAEAIVSHLDGQAFSRVDIAGPGFINLVIDWSLLEDLVAEVHKQDENFGRLAAEQRADQSFESVIVEYVSANPTGDLHLGHGRQAVLGSALVNLLRWAGYQASSEFYVNDAGVQMSKLANSAREALMVHRGKLKAEKYDEDNNYPLAAMQEIIEELSSKVPEDYDPEQCKLVAKEIYLAQQKQILSEAKVEFETWYSELDNLHQGEETKVDQISKQLKEAGYAYEQDAALWFKAQDFGDERDRVLRKADGYYTYLAADLAYHQDKLARGDRLINIWGADHHGQISGIKGALQALGNDPERLEIVLMQMVSLTKDGVEVKMSKRTGNFVTVRELIEEVGVDAFRYFLVESQANNRIVFDLDLACKQDKDNPVYYVQYAHARSCGILRNLTEQQADQSSLGASQVSDAVLSQDKYQTWMNDFKNNSALFAKAFANLNKEELRSTKALILALANFPEEIKEAAVAYAPYKIANYIKELAALFHQFYTHNRVINDDQDLMKARVSLVAATQKVLRNALNILGIAAPERM